MDLSKVTFGWNESLHALTRMRSAPVSKWLCDADGSEVKLQNKESKVEGKNSKDNSYEGSTLRGMGSDVNHNNERNLVIWDEG